MAPVTRKLADDDFFVRDHLDGVAEKLISH